MADRSYPERPIVGIGAVVLGKPGVLLIQRGKPPRSGSWSLPGGGQKLGETVEAAAIREVREETGLEIEVLGLVDVVDSIRTDEAGAVQYHYTLVDVAAVVTGGELAAGSDAKDARWFSFDEIAELEMRNTGKPLAAARLGEVPKLLDRRGLGLDPLDLAQPLLELVLLADDADAALHRGLQILVDDVGVVARLAVQRLGGAADEAWTWSSITCGACDKPPM